MSTTNTIGYQRYSELQEATGWNLQPPKEMEDEEPENKSTEESVINLQESVYITQDRRQYQRKQRQPKMQNRWVEESHE